MKSLTINTLVLCAMLALSSCYSSSSNKGGTTPTPPPNGTGDVNVDQFDANENSTEPLSESDQDVAMAAMTDVGRATHVQGKTQDANTPATPGGQLIDSTNKFSLLKDNQGQDQNQGSYYDQEQLSQQIIAAVNNQQKCNPTVTGNQSATGGDVKFTTSGAQCPMIMTMQMNSSVASTGQMQDIKASGAFKFAFNEQALTKLKEQDLISGDTTMSVTMKSKNSEPNAAINEMGSSGTIEQSGKLVSKRLGQIEANMKMVFAFEMKAPQGQMPSFVSKSVAQIELKAVNKRAVLTVKMDSQAAEPVKCTLNKKAIDLQLCEEMINKLNLNKQGQSQSPVADGETNNPPVPFPGEDEFN